MRKWLIILAAAAALFSIGPAQAQEQSAAGLVRDYLDTGMNPHAALGYAPERANIQIVQVVRTDSAFLWPVYLRAGVHYRIYGACDDHCTDMDLEIYGADGALMDRDAATNDTPYVQITPTTTGRHYVRFWIYACDREPCTAGARVVAGGRLAPRAAEPASETDAGPTDIIKGELDDSGEAQIHAGLTAFGQDVIQSVAKEGEGHRLRVHLEADVRYAFIGVCDADCHDVDMEILDPSGQSLRSDTESDDRPVIAFTPRFPGDYTVRIWLADCDNDQCFVGIRGFQGAVLEPRRDLPPSGQRRH